MHRATYSAEDNKLRIYPDNRLDDELGERYAEFKAAGYKWAAIQKCFVCPRWTPLAEDWALELAEEIEDEDYSPEERSADRAERFGGYRDKRRDKAHGHADNYEAGPAIFVHHRQERAERQARRFDRYRSHALNQWSKAEYWQARTAGVIRHALFRSSAHVRRGRLLRLEAEQRKQAKSLEAYAKRYELWQKISAEQDAEKATKWALAFVGSDCGGSWEYQHPRKPERKTSLYYLLTDKDDPISGHEASALWFTGTLPPGDPESSWERWARHYELRIDYEKAMLAAEGGMAAEADIEPGGWVISVSPWCCISSVPRGWLQVQAVTKSPKTGRVVSVKVWGTYKPSDGEPSKRLMVCNVERLAESNYRPPTDEEREAFKAEQAQAKAEKKAATPKSPPLINPTNDDAERLQAMWNARRLAKWEAKKKENPYIRDFEPCAVVYVTQAQYSARSKGSYASYETRTLHACGKPAWRSTNMWTQAKTEYNKTLGAAVAKIRISWHDGGHVVVITDKPPKPLPLDWEKLMAPAEQGEATQKTLFAEAS